MKIRLSLQSMVCLSIALALLAAIPASQAQSTAQLDKHSRKIEKRLTKFRAGTYLQVNLRDDTEVLGSLGQLADANFLLTSADNNRRMTIAYADVAHFKKGTEYIGAGSEPEHHPRLLVPVLIGAAAAGAAVAVVEIVH